MLGAFKSPAFIRRYDDPRDPGFGGSRKMSLVARSLLQGGNEVRILSSKIGYRSSLSWQSILPTNESYPEGDVRILHASTLGLRPFGAAMMSLMMPLKIIQTVRAWRPHVIFCYNADFPEAVGSVLAWKWLQVPYVLEIDDLPSVRRHCLHPKAILDSFGWGPVVKHARSLIVVNSQLFPLVRPNKRRCVLLPGIVEDLLVEAARKRKRAFSGAERSILYAGGLSEGRGSDRLLAAIPKLPPGWKATIAGSGPLAESFQQLAQEQPRQCEFLGSVSAETLYRRLATSDVVVNTPEQLRDQAGVFPFKMFEYIVSNAHIITTPLPELAGIDLKWLKIWSGNPDDFTTLLHSAVDDYNESSAAREHCRQQIISKFSLSAVSQQLSGLLHEAGIVDAGGCVGSL